MLKPVLAVVTTRHYRPHRADNRTDAFTAFVEDRLSNGKGDFNEENWRSYLVSGQPR